MSNRLAPDGYLRVHRFVASSNVLGPGNRSILWTQGCLRNCKGCMSQRSRILDGGEILSLDIIYNWIINADLNEVTISGGEPFLQDFALSQLVERLHSNNIGVIIYTGNKYEDLIKTESTIIKKIFSNIDILIDGEYIDDLNNGQSMIGSTNQRIIKFTDRYSDDIINKTYGHFERKIEILIEDNRVFVVGVPDKEEFENIIEIIEK